MIKYTFVARPRSPYVRLPPLAVRKGAHRNSVQLWGAKCDATFLLLSNARSNAHMLSEALARASFITQSLSAFQDYH